MVPDNGGAGQRCCLTTVLPDYRGDMPDGVGSPRVPALVRAEQHAAGVDALAARSGGRVGLAGVLAHLERHARQARTPIPGAVRRLTWDAADRRTRRWWPQGITTSADASPEGTVLGRRLLAVSWYARQQPGTDHPPGTRVSFLDLDTLRYQHVALVRAVTDLSGQVRTQAVRAHAGGLVWRGDWLHVAATRRGFLSFRLADMLQVDGELVLPLREAYRPLSPDDPEVLRHSFLSLDRRTTPPGLLAGEYARGDQPTRLVRYPLDADGRPVTERPGPDGGDQLIPTWTAAAGLPRMQGAAWVRDHLVVTTSHGSWAPGALVVGQPGAWRQHRWVLPMGPEAIAWSPAEDLLWTLSEHPRRRWLLGLSAARYR